MQQWRQLAGRVTARALSAARGILHRRFPDAAEGRRSRVRGHADSDIATRAAEEETALGDVPRMSPGFRSRSPSPHRVVEHQQEDLRWSSSVRCRHGDKGGDGRVDGHDAPAAQPRDGGGLTDDCGVPSSRAMTAACETPLWAVTRAPGGRARCSRRGWWWPMTSPGCNVGSCHRRSASLASASWCRLPRRRGGLGVRLAGPGVSGGDAQAAAQVRQCQIGERHLGLISPGRTLRSSPSARGTRPGRCRWSETCARRRALRRGPHRSL